ncbi:MAG: redoxin family protein [Cytophagales bacterium]|nr:redoxin family protein [Cytophagales bacterium]
MRFPTLAVAIIVLCIFHPVQAQENPPTLPLGSQAPDFNLLGVDGKNYSLADFKKAKVLAVLFTCNHCPTAQAYEDRVIQLVRDYNNEGFALVAISPNSEKGLLLSELGYSDMGDSYEDMQIRHKDKGYNFPYLYDGDTQETALKYGPVATPHLFIFDEGRKLRYVGRLDASEKPGTANAGDARSAIDALLSGKPVAKGQTKTFGCSVKWGWKVKYKEKTLKEWAEMEVGLEEINPAQIKELIKNDSGKLRLINVWATWCGPCVAEFPDFIEIDRMYRGRDFEFVSISADRPEQKDRVLAFLKKKQASNKNYIFNSDDKYALIEAIDPNWRGALPYTILVEPGGKIVYSQEGTIDVFKMKKTIVENPMLGRYY